MVPDDDNEPTTGSDHQRPERRDEAPDHYPPDQPIVQGSRSDVPATVKDDTLETNEIVAVLAALIPGLGQMILGQTVKGLVILGFSILTACIGGVVSVASVVDAFLVAKAKKRRAVGEWEFFPDFKETFGL